MPQPNPQAAREFSIEVVRKLRDAGYQALWAGGCVRDQLLGKTPKDYDVATDATPDQVRTLFGHRRTLAIGAAFGVISIIGSPKTGNIEVATFREDGGYSDGRRPDSVRYADAQADAQRRDFTINGMFFDPLSNETIDFVGGEEDLQRRIVRAIGDPAERIAEDKLRMLRAVRFAATLEFEIDPQTLQVVREQAEQLQVVSAERIAAELERMLSHPCRGRAIDLMQHCQLLPQVIPQWEPILQAESWSQHRAVVDQLPEDADASMTLAVLLRPLYATLGPEIIEAAVQRLRLSREAAQTISHILNHEAMIRAADQEPWPTVQRVLASPRVKPLLQTAYAIAKGLDQSTAGVQFCQRKIELPQSQWDPQPLLNGNDLHELGVKPGPSFRLWLNAIRDEQLLGRLQTRQQAIEWCRQRLAGGPDAD